jgi:hypothetical protein
MVNTQVNAPAAVVVIVAPAVPTVQLLTWMEIPSNTKVTPEETAKPVAVTVTLVPTRPLVTERGEMVHVVTVNGAEAVCPPAASVATTAPAPASDPVGMVKTQVNAPAAVVVIVAPAVPTVQLLTVMAKTPSNESVTPEEAAKPVAVTVTLVPMTPLVTDSGEIVHVETVNVAEAVCPPAASVATRLPTAPPVDPAGIVKTHVKAPAAVVVIVAPAVPTEQLLTVIGIPSNARVTPEETAKPVPVTVTLAPMTPLVAEREMVQSVTAYGALSFCPVVLSLASIVAAVNGVPAGMGMMQTNAPAAVVVMVDPEWVHELPPVGVATTPPTDSVTSVLAPNAAPVAVTELPITPPADERVRTGGVNAVVPVTVPTPTTVAVADTVYV